MRFYVYILRSDKDGTLYVGHTNNLAKRMQQHNSSGKKTYTAARGPWGLVYSEACSSRTQAVRRELFLKSHAGAYEKKKLACSKQATSRLS
ncbi:MAG: GIY-YIG nuclease family protein [Sedimentisphaerales bacterium]|nr:GIY-YIG nuclease family protein [Sedimentisphaerales bacterium]